MIVNPATGALVRDPVTAHVVEPGAEVDPTQPYWGRLLADGDIVAADDGDDSETTAALAEPVQHEPDTFDEDDDR